MYKYLMAVVVLLAGFSAYSANKNVTYLVAYESEGFASTQMYNVEVTSEFTETVELDGGYTLEVIGSPTGVSTVLKSPAGETELVTNQSTNAFLKGNLFLICSKSGVTNRISPIPKQLPSCNPT
ncbi:hypothetical protein QWI17_05950 [Gilvimarinus sp. SDUM040013]|uniref:Uncharacterized protein n=1 Tax=Gilvimarinus gilvus TaxID=3058038 RepID=A0ABU4S1J0_9GAMM|nr:hypothetical protein [Gilvimarinus sp. SDUM040013]MDO3385382.1 hypothetical protein [Gilvimarinus sp. SDUM040013]MDX6850957.1 hypothetical protein [Gilvimarinus sp. SDUM040013]